MMNVLTLVIVLARKSLDEEVKNLDRLEDLSSAVSLP